MCVDLSCQRRPSSYFDAIRTLETELPASRPCHRLLPLRRDLTALSEALNIGPEILPSLRRSRRSSGQGHHQETHRLRALRISVRQSGRRSVAESLCRYRAQATFQKVQSRGCYQVSGMMVSSTRSIERL